MSNTTPIPLTKILEDIGEDYKPFVFFVDTATFFMNRDNFFDTQSFSLMVDKEIYKKCVATTIPVIYTNLINIIKDAISENMIIYIVKDLNNLFVLGDLDSNHGEAFIYMYKSSQTLKYFRKIKMDKIFQHN